MVWGWGCFPSRIFFLKNVENAEKFLKSSTLNGAFLRYLKQCFGSWDCGETFDNKDANWYFLAVFKTILWKLELRRNF